MLRGLLCLGVGLIDKLYSGDSLDAWYLMGIGVGGDESTDGENKSTMISKRHSIGSHGRESSKAQCCSDLVAKSFADETMHDFR